MLEVELKSLLDDWDARRSRIASAGAVVTFQGRMTDCRYDSPSLTLAALDHVLRLRIYEGSRQSAQLDWKGPTAIRDGFKEREELTTGILDASALASMLDNLGYVVTREIEREVVAFDLQGCVIRFERYPRMDDLVEVEGPIDSIERAIVALGIARSEFTAERLPDFARRFEVRTGQRAALSARELAGDYRYSLDQA